MWCPLIRQSSRSCGINHLSDEDPEVKVRHVVVCIGAVLSGSIDHG